MLDNEFTLKLIGICFPMYDLLDQFWIFLQ